MSTSHRLKTEVMRPWWGLERGVSTWLLMLLSPQPPRWGVSSEVWRHQGLIILKNLRFEIYNSFILGWVTSAFSPADRLTAMDPDLHRLCLHPSTMQFITDFRMCFKCFSCEDGDTAVFPSSCVIFFFSVGHLNCCEKAYSHLYWKLF